MIKPVTQSKILNNHLKRVISDDAFAAKTIVVCSVLKDVFAYSVRYKTTMENKKIPEKRRPFVAAMDLASGIVTAIAQIAVGFSIANPKLQNALWNKMFKNAQFKHIGAAKKSFATILALVGSGVITERIIVPLLATPLAAFVEKKFFKHDPAVTATKKYSNYPFNTHKKHSVFKNFASSNTKKEHLN